MRDSLEACGVSIAVVSFVEAAEVEDVMVTPKVRDERIPGGHSSHQILLR
ncbi:hypothetical protein [Paraburkholderia caffeinilytica]